MENRGITAMGAIQFVVLIGGWIMASIVVRQSFSWSDSHVTFGKIYRMYGLLLLILPAIWMFAANAILQRDGGGIRVLTMYVAGFLLILLFFGLSFLAIVSAALRGGPL